MHISLVSYIVLVTRVKFNEKGGLMFDNTKGNIVPIKSDKVFHILLNKENMPTLEFVVMHIMNYFIKEFMVMLK